MMKERIELEHTVSGRSIVVVSQEHISCDLAAEVAILNVTSGIYYGFNTVGTRIWKLIQEPRTVHEIRDALLEEYEVEPERCERDVFVLLQELASKGLIEIKDDTVT
jgi:coenzyme PQQ synthesis protein D (PqqD)